MGLLNDTSMKVAGLVGALVLMALATPLAAVAQGAPADCLEPDGTDIAVCEPFLAFWQANGGGEVFGLPLTEDYDERSADTLDILRVQYFERARLEHHPELAGTQWEFTLGRLGSEALKYGEGIDWNQLPTSEPTADNFFAVTGHAIGLEFWDEYRSSGIDLGDEGVSFRESLAPFGYPITNVDVDPTTGVAVQWFERARFEVGPDGVVIASLGHVMTDISGGDFSPRIEREFDANLAYWHDALNVPGIMAGIWVEGVGSWQNVIGVADRETGEALAFDQHVRAGSITKTFTGTLILQLAEQGALSVDDPISMYLDGVPNGDNITLRHLAEMSSGLASYTWDPDFQDEYFENPQLVWSPDELVQIGYDNTEAGCPYAPPNWPACFEPGTSFFYSNTNTVMLGMVVEVVTGMSYAEALQEMILDPLALDNTSAPLESTLPQPYAHGYTFQGLPDGATQQQEATFWDPSWAFAVGNIVTTFDDLRVWARALGTGELLSPELQAQRLMKLPAGFGNGIITEQHSYAFGIGYMDGWWGHEGELPGYNATVYYRPDVEAVIVVAVNSDAVPLEDGAVSPAGAFTSALVEIGAREAPIGGIDADPPFGEAIP